MAVKNALLGLVLVMLYAVIIDAQHHHHDDPFAGSNCTCETFCNRECAINATQPKNTTYYRMTPLVALDMDNKNTGDVAGDTSFVLSRRLDAYECRVNPNNFYCTSVTQFDGDEPNSTDLVMAFEIETDGQWGPYLYCNPANISLPQGPWACTTQLNPGTVNPQCQSHNETIYKGYCFEGDGKSMNVTSLGDCCIAAAKEHSAYSYFPNGTCTIFPYEPYPQSCSDGISGRYEPPEPVCECDRVHETVGKRNLSSSSYGSHDVTGGEWFSHPAKGECRDGHFVGDGSGCTWRVVDLQRVINATCMYKLIDETVVNFNSSCFNQCPQPKNMTSDCWLHCYNYNTEKMTKSELVAPWGKAFASPEEGGCPQVHLPPQTISRLLKNRLASY